MLEGLRKTSPALELIYPIRSTEFIIIDIENRRSSLSTNALSWKVVLEYRCGRDTRLKQCPQSHVKEHGLRNLILHQNLASKQ